MKTEQIIPLILIGFMGLCYVLYQIFFKKKQITSATNDVSSTKAWSERLRFTSKDRVLLWGWYIFAPLVVLCAQALHAFFVKDVAFEEIPEFFCDNWFYSLLLVISTISLVTYIKSKSLIESKDTKKEAAPTEKTADDKKKDALKPITPKSVSWRIKNLLWILISGGILVLVMLWIYIMVNAAVRDFSYHGPDPYAQRAKTEVVPAITYSPLDLKQSEPFMVFWQESIGSFIPVEDGICTIRFRRIDNLHDHFDLRITRESFKVITERLDEEGSHSDGYYTATISRNCIVEYRSQKTEPLIHLAH